MPVASTIAIKLDAQTATLKKGFAESRQAIDRLGAGLSGKVATGMAKFHVALAAVKGGLASVRAGINAVFSAMGQIDQTEKFAARIGIAADQLRILNFAAEQTGASAGTMQMALQRMTRRVAEAAQGTGEAKGALQELGLSAEYLNSLSPDQQFGAIAEAMKGVNLQSDKVRLAMKLFDSEGVALVNTLAVGADGLNAFGKEAENAGMLLGDNTKVIEDTNDAINRMKKAWAALVQRIAIAVAPILEQMAKILERVIGLFNRLWGISGQASDMGAGAAKAAASFVPPIAEETKKAAEEAKKAAADLAKRGESITDSMRTPAEVFKDSIVELNQLFNAGAITAETYTRAATKARDALAKSMTEVKESAATPGIAAVTRRSGAFGAIQQANRQRKDEERRHKEMLAHLRALESAVRGSGVVLAPVKL